MPEHCYRFPCGGGVGALICVLVLGLFIITGCNGTNGPISMDALSGFFRSGMGFGSGNNWSHGYSLDSASTIWVYPAPSGILPGDIAETDVLPTQPPTIVEPLVTAFVTHTREMPTSTSPSEIELIMIDENKNEVYSDTFYGDHNTDKIFCRHPVVEVTYERETESETGYLRTHIIWSQLTKTGNDEHWDLYYRYLVWYANEEDEAF